MTGSIPGGANLENPDWIVTVESGTGYVIYDVLPPAIQTTSETLQEQLLEVIFATLNTFKGTVASDYFTVQADPDIVTGKLNITIEASIATSFLNDGQIKLTAQTRFTESFSVSGSN